LSPYSSGVLGLLAAELRRLVAGGWPPTSAWIFAELARLLARTRA
jgi:hypothetical protein